MSLKHSLIRYFPCHKVHELVMIHAGKVDVRHQAVTVLDVGSYLLYCIFCISPSSESIAVFGKSGSKIGINSLLNYSVNYCRNTKLSVSTARIGNSLSPDGWHHYAV